MSFLLSPLREAGEWHRQGSLIMCYWYRPTRRVSLLLALVSTIFLVPDDTRAQTLSLLRNGDRVVLLGGTFIERMQTHGYLETELATRLHGKNLTFRNLGWSGDNVLGESRAVFGAVAEGYSRLLRDLKLASPSVVILHYGVVEAREGPAGVAAFRRGLSRLVEDIGELDSRVILLAPRPQTEMGPPFPVAAPYNQSLELYREVIKEIARASSATVVDLHKPGQTRFASTVHQRARDGSVGSRSPFRGGFSLDGLQLTAVGYWEQASSLANELAGSREELRVTVDVPTKRITATGATAELSTEGPGGLTIDFQRNALPSAYRPGIVNRNLEPLGLTLTITGLPAGRYGVNVDSKGVGDAFYSARQLTSGVVVPAAEGDRVTELRRTIARKNEFFFHRYRPQNETYLFLFRKHEQGNNAAEIPMFDPLVEALDREIHRLARPPVRQVVIRRRPSR